MYFALIMLLVTFNWIFTPYTLCKEDETKETTPNDTPDSKKAELDSKKAELDSKKAELEAEKANREVANDNHSESQDRDDEVAENRHLQEMEDSEDRISFLEKAIKVLEDLFS